MLRRLCIVGTLLVLFLSVGSNAHADGITRQDVRDEIRSYLQEHSAPPPDHRVLSKSGINLKSGDLTLNIGGRALIDTIFHETSNVTQGSRVDGINNGIEFRQVWLRFAPSFGKYLSGKIQLAFETGNIIFQDVYFDVHKLRDCFGCGVPNLRVGHFFEPFSLNKLTPGTRLTFLERALPVALAPFRNTGVMLHDDFRGGRFGYAAGVFGNSNRVGLTNFNRDGHAATARVWATPWTDCHCLCKRLHLGFSYSHRWDLNGVRYGARPEDHLARVLIDTDFSTDAMGQPLLADANRVNEFAAEIALVFGRFSVQAEYIRSAVSSAAGGGPVFDGWYAFASYWITGECRKYAKGNFAGRITPCREFLEKDCCGSGGWEVAVRYSTLDLNDSNIQGGKMSDITLGVNWHLHPNARVMFNYVRSRIDDDVATGQDLNTFAIRVQFDL